MANMASISADRQCTPHFLNLASHVQVIVTVIVFFQFQLHIGLIVIYRQDAVKRRQPVL